MAIKQPIEVFGYVTTAHRVDDELRARRRGPQPPGVNGQAFLDPAASLPSGDELGSLFCDVRTELKHRRSLARWGVLLIFASTARARIANRKQVLDLAGVRAKMLTREPLC